MPGHKTTPTQTKSFLSCHIQFFCHAGIEFFLRLLALFVKLVVVVETRPVCREGLGTLAILYHLEELSCTLSHLQGRKQNCVRVASV